MKKNDELFNIYLIIYKNIKTYLLISLFVFSIYFIIGSKLFKKYYQAEMSIGSKSFFELDQIFDIHSNNNYIGDSDSDKVKKKLAIGEGIIFEIFLNNLKSIELKKDITNKFNINNMNIEINYRRSYSDAVISLKGENNNIDEILMHATVLAQQRTIDSIKKKYHKIELINYYSKTKKTINKLYDIKNIVILFFLNIILTFLWTTTKEFRKLI